MPPLEVARRMCDAIYHRGPDAEGIHYSPEVVLGMRRLAIIDPNGGEQPIYNESRDICTVVNGEIYNYRELRGRLERLGHVFRTGSDVECVVHAYEEYGTECFAELRGMFAIAIWDARSRSLVLARDRFGKKPLFYTETSRGMFFASELKSLLQVPEIQPELNRGVVAEYMMLGYVPTPASIFNGVQKLKPAHYMVFHDGYTRIRNYWSLRYSPKLEMSEHELTDMLDAEIDSAVRVRLESDVPFGAFLSGGVDSSLVVAMMTRHLDAPVQTFSIGSEDARLDESEDARRIAGLLGTEHHALTVRPDAVELLEQISWYMDEPMADSSIIPTFLVSQLAAEHVKMVLTGDGGDEMFGGYSRYVRYQQLRMMRGAGAAQLAPLLKLLADRLPSVLAQRVGRACSRLAMQHPDDYLASVALATPPAITGLLHPDCIPTSGFGAVRNCFSNEADGMGALDGILQGDVRSYLLDDILVKVDRASMANSLEARAPLLDHRLAEFAARLPEQFKLRGNSTKYLLKRVAERYIPAELVHKKKRGFAIPLASWLRNDLADLMQDTFNSRAFADRGVFDVEAARRLATEHVNGTRNNAETLWAMLVFEKWAERFSGEVQVPESRPGLAELRPAAG